ncbi:unnamed protein product [Amoebophrya sp. A25]|nr:unnamed protein product [Amoebophrya sp. A25]|eukprot:GSA25T00000585001.1
MSMQMNSLSFQDLILRKYLPSCAAVTEWPNYYMHQRPARPIYVLILALTWSDHEVVDRFCVVMGNIFMTQEFQLFKQQPVHLIEKFIISLTTCHSLSSSYEIQHFNITTIGDNSFDFLFYNNNLNYDQASGSSVQEPSFLCLTYKQHYLSHYTATNNRKSCYRYAN